MELRRAGRVVRYEPDAEVLHLEHGAAAEPAQCTYRPETALGLQLNGEPI
jgi:hypothetical protein